MKKTLLTAFAFGVLVLAVPKAYVYALPNITPPLQPAIDTTKLVETLKTAYGKIINQILTVVNTAQGYLTQMPVPEGSSCSVDTSLQKLETYLIDQLAKVEAATTLAELQAIQKETVTYLKDHKEDITNSVNNYVDCAYTATVSSLNTYLTYADAQAKVMELKGEDTTQLKSDISSARSLVAKSQSEYDAATSNKEKNQAYKTLSQTAPYIQSINTILTQ